MAGISVYCVIQQGWYIKSLLSIVSFFSFCEWIFLSSAKGLEHLRPYGFVVLLCFHVCMLYLQQETLSLLRLFAVVWSTDCGAYFSGKILGGPKLWVKLSPNKTISGLLGGILSGCVGGMILGGSSMSCLAVSCASQCGDLIESYVKRIADVKDSNLPGFCIPGHGGVLDRIDALIVATPMAVLCRL
jgi:phosphatidate cytidylyltransferase